MNAQGIPGRAPSLHGVGALAADFYLQTGRMPLPSPRQQPLRTRPAFGQPQIAALVAYVASFGGPPIPVVEPRRGSLSDGQRLFEANCAGCHTIQAQGGIVTGAIAPSLSQATPRQIAQAIRIGPYVMPRFGEGELSNGQIDSIARYVQSTRHPEDRGGWGIGRIGPIPEGMVAWLLAMAALLLIARLLGERTPDEPPPAPRGEASR
jgi:ubiquinol-cytochrome c reductase cytochrome c subunit